MRCALQLLRNITMKSQWVRSRLKSPASRLFTQSFIQTQIKETSKLRVIGLSPRWIPRTNGQLRGKCFHLMTSSWNSWPFCSCLWQECGDMTSRNWHHAYCGQTEYQCTLILRNTSKQLSVSMRIILGAQPCACQTLIYLPRVRAICTQLIAWLARSHKTNLLAIANIFSLEINGRTWNLIFSVGNKQHW